MGRILTKEEWMSRKKHKRQALLLVAAALMLAILILLALIIGKLIIRIFVPAENSIETIDITLSNGTIISKNYLTPNSYSRPQTKLKKVKGIEDETGVFTEKTYKSLVALTAELCREFSVEEEGILRHYDVNKKQCPLYFVEHEEAWNKLKKDVMTTVKE